MRGTLSLLGILCLTTALAGQVPKPFPKPGEPPAQPTGAPATAPPQTAAPSQPGTRTPRDTAEPADGSLGVTIYPAAQFIASFDAGKGQRYYLYGTTTSFAEIVQYYRTLLRQRGDLVFEQPPVHQFDLGRFREESMAFPPSVTVKDYTSGPGGGYMNPKRGAQPQRFPTIIQVVPNPPVVSR